MPAVDRFAYLRWPGFIAVAHRGGAEEAPENSLAAFANAYRLGYRYLETDVHATRDGRLVAFHDERLERMTDGAGALAELTFAEVRRARIGGREPIPSLDELFESFPDARFNIDPKADAAVDPLIAAIRRHDAHQRVCVGSFSGRRLDRVRAALGPALCTSMGPRDVIRWRLASFGIPVGRFVVGCAQVPVRQYGLSVVDSLSLRAARARGLQVHVWTINDEAEMERLIDLGVDALMTDRPRLLKAVLQRRGLWWEAGG